MLEAARGSIRDTLGAIRNVQQLLRSIKVGPKAIATVVPDLHASCGPLLESFGSVLDAAALSAPGAAATLRSFVEPRIRALETALGEANGNSVNARQRLRLEEVVSRVAVELDAARGLVELLEEAAGAARAKVDLAELVKQIFKIPPEKLERSPELLFATLAPNVHMDIWVSPRVAMSIIAFGVRMMAGRDAGTAPHLSVVRDASGESALRITKSPGRGELYLVQAPRLIEPSVECVQAALQALGGRSDRSVAGVLNLYWPPGGE